MAVGTAMDCKKARRFNVVCPPLVFRQDFHFDPGKDQLYTKKSISGSVSLNPE
jgi:hypothetical protein